MARFFFLIRYLVYMNLLGWCGSMQLREECFHYFLNEEKGSCLLSGMKSNGINEDFKNNTKRLNGMRG